MIGDLKEVFYYKYCSKCKYANLRESEEPCNDCLSEPGVEDSHKPLKFEEKER